MQVDKVSAMQGVGDLRSEVDPLLCDTVRTIMSKISKPGTVKRAEFDLNEFLTQLAGVDFDNNNPLEVARLFKVLGESLSSGLTTARR